MKFACIFLLFASVLVGFSVAETVTGKVYPTLFGFEEVRIKEVKPNGVQIVHKWGGRFVPISKIPEDLREELGLTVEAAEKYEFDRKRKALMKRSAKLEKKLVLDSLVVLRGNVLQRLDGGLLINKAKYVTKSSKKVKKREPYTIYGKSGPTLLEPGRRRQKVTRYRDVWDWEYYITNVGLCYVECAPGDLYDGMSFSRVVYKSGDYSYTTAMGVRKIVPRYSTDISGRLEKLQSKNR